MLSFIFPACLDDVYRIHIRYTEYTGEARRPIITEGGRRSADLRRVVELGQAAVGEGRRGVARGRGREVGGRGGVWGEVRR